MSRMFVVGARGSRLSLRQVELVIAALRAAHPSIAVAVREIKTEGDRSTAPLSEIGGAGVFTKAIEDALLAGGVDIAVHSLKDLPPRLPEGLTIAAVPARGDARDALVTAGGRSLGDLPAGARIGTGSERRAVQLLELRADVRPVEIRGNVDTRVRKVESGEYDGVVLALAGLERLGLGAKVAQVFSAEEMLPAVGQAALAVEVRADDAEAVRAVCAIDDARSREAVMAERAFLDELGAGCRLPVGAHATVEGSALTLTAMVAREGRLVREVAAGAVGDGESLGRGLARALLGVVGGG